MSKKGGYFMTDEEREEWEKEQKELEKLIDKCVFCNIAYRNDCRADIVYKDSRYVVFRDIRPSAKEHYLIIPKKHIKDTKVLGYDDIPMIKNMIEVAKLCLKKHGANVEDVRYGFHLSPLVSVDHLHMHVLAPATRIGFFGKFLFRPDSYWFITVDTLLKRLQEKPSKFWSEGKPNGDWHGRQITEGTAAGVNTDLKSSPGTKEAEEKKKQGSAV
ncbi:adenosine 5'-monophosphoramidase HINT3-like [Glandiceps talaboti]